MVVCFAKDEPAEQETQFVELSEHSKHSVAQASQTFNATFGNLLVPHWVGSTHWYELVLEVAFREVNIYNEVLEHLVHSVREVHSAQFGLHATHEEFEVSA